MSYTLLTNVIHRTQISLCSTGYSLLNIQNQKTLYTLDDSFSFVPLETISQLRCPPIGNYLILAAFWFKLSYLHKEFLRSDRPKSGGMSIRPTNETENKKLF